MLGYFDLPLELRQHILGHLIPEKVVYQRWPTELVNLFLVNKQFLEDVSHLLQVSPPIYVVTSPCTSQPQYRICPQQRVLTLCLSLFDSADTQMNWITTHEVGFARKIYFGLLQQWFYVLPRLLTPDIKTVMVDGTLASGSVRRESPEYLAFLVNDTYYRGRTLRRHESQMLGLIRQILSRTHGAKIQFVGVYSTKHRRWLKDIANICRHEGIDLEMKVDKIDKPNTLLSTASLTQAATQVRPEMQDLGQDFPDRLQACEALRLAEWKPETLELYRNCGSKHPTWTVELLRQCASFYGNRYLLFQSITHQTMSAEQCGLFLNLVEDLGLSGEVFTTEGACKFHLIKRASAGGSREHQMEHDHDQT